MKARISFSAVLFGLQCLATRCQATNTFTPDAAEADVTTTGLQRVLWNLNKIGRDNGGNRAFGMPGFDASMEFVLERAVTRFGKHMDTWVQPFNHTFEQTREISVTGPDDEDVYVITCIYNPATPAGGITAPVMDTPVNDETGSMCLPEDWEGIDATGKLVLIKRGLCAISDKLKLARAHGAVGVLLYNQNPGTDYGQATLGAENRNIIVPMGIIPLEVGQKWSAALEAGEEVTATLLVDSIFEERETWNIISETKEGDPNNVIMLGAHLDSVQAGAGVNDDGSGTAALLEIMGSIKKYKGFKNKVRFAWWGAEEVGLVGSLFYTRSLSPEDADKIRYYFNYDMIGSPAPTYTVYDGESTGAKKLYDYLVQNDLPAAYAPFGSSSDYVGFLELGIPSSGLFTGAGAPQDPCYHQLCDDIDNINWDAITTNTKAAARALADFAESLDGIPKRNEPAAVTTPNRRSLAQRRTRNGEMTAASWDMVMADVQEARSCSHDHDHDNVY